MNNSFKIILFKHKHLLIVKEKRKNMYEDIPCPNPGCSSGKIHALVGFDIFWNVCPICSGLGSIRRSVPNYVPEHQN
jgi:hypothetical protein